MLLPFNITNKRYKSTIDSTSTTIALENTTLIITKEEVSSSVANHSAIKLSSTNNFTSIEDNNGVLISKKITEDSSR